jgi:hypothetical protein
LPSGLDATQRAVLEVINRNGAAYSEAVRETDVRPLQGVFTGAAYDHNVKIVTDLDAARQYMEAELVTISLVEYRLDGPNSAYVRTEERWKFAVFERATGRRVRVSEEVYREEYRLFRADVRWLIGENNVLTISTAPN